MATLTLHKGDCLAIMKDISANSIDLIICDLPYGCLSVKGVELDASKTKHGHGVPKSTGCAWDIKIDLEKFWTEAKRILKNEHCPVIHFCTTKFGFELYKSNPDWFRYDLVWNKQRGVSFLTANKMPMRSHEMIYVFSKAGAYYNRVDISGNYPETRRVMGKIQSKVYGMEMNDKFFHKQSPADKRCALSIINVQTKAIKGNHPTEKPIDLYKWLIQRYCPPGGTVLDPTFGSGNSVFTAFEMGMNAIGIEKDDKFYEKAEKKLNTIE
jgi:site-specific DNA-methyltransferase (adenine-specific)